MTQLNKRNRKHGQMSDSFLTAAFLSASGGLQDAYTYIARGEVFANAQTGNIVLLSQNLFTGNWPRVLHYLIPLLAFALGVAAAEQIRFRYQNAQAVHWRQLVVLGEILLLFAVGFLPHSLDLPADALVSFACAMQVQAFRKVEGYSFASTMCIGNLRSGVEALCACLRTGNQAAMRKAVHYFGVILLFALGAGLGSLCIPALGKRTIWLSCALLLISFCLMFIKEELEDDPNLRCAEQAIVRNKKAVETSRTLETDLHEEEGRIRRDGK